MKTAELLCWAQTPNDAPDTASSVIRLVGPQSKALRAAVYLEDHGDTIGGVVIPCGHGVTIRYASGRKRHVSVRNCDKAAWMIDLDATRADAQSFAAMRS